MIKTAKNVIAKRREEQGENDKGFTLIELLVVVLIIGILAAIAIPAFLSQREGAWIGQAESDLNSARIAAETYAINKNGSFAALDEAALAANGYKETQDVKVTVTAKTANSYKLTAVNSNVSAKPVTYDSTTGKIVKTP